MTCTQSINMVTPEQVQIFLHDFKVKLSIWGMIFRDDRGKNTQALLTLEITPVFREKIIKELELIDYSAGPKKELIGGGSDMWIFGKMINKQEVYIKITLGFAGAQVICISFHIAEHEMKYPYKK